MGNSDIDETKEEQSEVDEKLFYAERAKTGRAKCKKCKNTIDAGTLRLAKSVMNPFGTGKMKVWHHLPCLFEVFKKQRATTPKIEKIDDIGGFESLPDEDIEVILKFLPDGMYVPTKNIFPKFPDINFKLNIMLQTLENIGKNCGKLYQMIVYYLPKKKLTERSLHHP